MDQNTIRLYVPAGTLYDTDRITGAPVFNKFTGEQAQDGVSIDGSDAGGAIHYLSRADFNKTFPKANVPVRRLSHKGAALNLYTKELADTWHSDETWTASDEALRDKKSVKKLTLMVERMGSLTDLGYVHNNPIMSVGTLGLPVSPALKLTDKGLVDVKKGEIVPLIISTKKNK